MLVALTLLPSCLITGPEHITGGLTIKTTGADISCIIIKSPSLNNTQEILNRLHLENYQPTEKVALCYTTQPETLYAVFYNGNFILVHPDIPLQFFTPIPTATDLLFREVFPECEIAVLLQNYTVGLYGYVVIDQSRTIRKNNGTDDLTFYDKGNLLPEEKEISGREIFDADEIKEMQADGMTDQEIITGQQHEANFRIPALRTNRYLGKPWDAIDCQHILLTRYQK